MVRTRNTILPATAVILLALAASASAQEYRLPVEHAHAIGSCRGELVVDAVGVEYRTDEKKHTRKWSHTDIRLMKVQPREVDILTYEGTWKKLGGDRRYKFEAAEGIPEGMAEFLLERIRRPLVMGLADMEGTPTYEIPVRHRHRFGGCEGVLRIYADRVEYLSEREDGSRLWRLSDIRGISRSGPYRFSLKS